MIDSSGRKGGAPSTQLNIIGGVSQTRENKQGAHVRQMDEGRTWGPRRGSGGAHTDRGRVLRPALDSRSCRRCPNRKGFYWVLLDRKRSSAAHMETRTWIWTQALLMSTKVEAEASPGTHLLSGFLFFY